MLIRTLDCCSCFYKSLFILHMYVENDDTVSEKSLNIATVEDDNSETES